MVVRSVAGSEEILKLLMGKNIRFESRGTPFRQSGYERRVSESVQIDDEVLHRINPIIPGAVTFVGAVFAPFGKDVLGQTDRFIGTFIEELVEIPKNMGILHLVPEASFEFNIRGEERGETAIVLSHGKLPHSFGSSIRLREVPPRHTDVNFPYRSAGKFS